MTSLRIWILASRPKTLWAGIAPVIIGTAMAFSDGGAHWPAALCALAGSILIQIGTNLANDYYDYIKGSDRSDRKGPVRVTQAGLVDKNTIRRAVFVVFGLAVVSGFYLIYRGGWPILAIGMISILFGILYTGGPIPIGYIGLGEVFVFIFYGFIAVGGTYYVQTLTITPEVIAAGTAPGLFSSAILAVNNLRDIDEDRKSNKNTLAVRFGRTFARYEYVFCIVSGSVIPVFISIFTGSHIYAAVSGIVAFASIPAVKKVFSSEEGPVLNSVLADTGKLLLAFSIVFSTGWILS